MQRRNMQLARNYAQRLRERLGENLKQVILFGSRARGKTGKDSDFDFVVVVKKRTKSVRESVLDVDVEMMNDHSALFAPMIYDGREWERAKEFPLGWNVEREGISL